MTMKTHPLGQWATLAVLSSVTALCMGGILVSLSVYVPAINKAEQWGDAATGGALTLLLLAASLAGIAAGTIADRTDPRRVLAAGVLLTGLGCWIATCWSSVVSFLFGFALIGIGLGAATLAPSISILTAVYASRQGLALGVYFAMLAFGAAVGPLVHTSLIASFGWRYAMQMTGVVVAATVILAYLIPRPPRQTPSAREQLGAGAARNVGWAQVGNRRFLYLVGGMVLAAFSTQGVLYSYVAYLVKFGMEPETAAGVFSVTNFLAVPALFVVGVMADRWGPGRIMAMTLAAQGFGSIALLAVFVVQPWGLISLAAFVLAWGALSGMYSQLAPMILRRIVPAENFGMLVGFSNAVSGIISAFSPLFTAGLLGLEGSYTSVFIVYCAMCLIAIPLFLLAGAAPLQVAAYRAANPSQNNGTSYGE